MAQVCYGGKEAKLYLLVVKDDSPSLLGQDCMAATTKARLQAKLSKLAMVTPSHQFCGTLERPDVSGGN